MTKPISKWEEKIAANPEHSVWYAERFKQMQAAGKDLFGEARLIDAMLQRGSSILDAGCGPGRLGGYLAAQGHKVVGVDVDPYLIAEATRDYPTASWQAADLYDFQREERFDLIVSAGNVVTFFADGSHSAIYKNLALHLKEDGRLVIGFGTDRGYSAEQFFEDAKSAGFFPEVLLSTWDLKPYQPTDNFLVAVLAKG